MTSRSPIGRYQVETPLGPVWLNTDERNVRIRSNPVVLPAGDREAPLTTLCRQAAVDRPEDIGKNGPVIASVSDPANAGNLELRRYEDVFTPDSLLTAKSVRAQFPLLEEATVLYVAPYVAEDEQAGPGATRGAVPHHFYLRTDERPPAYRRTDGNLLFLTSAYAVMQRRSELVSAPLRVPAGQPNEGRVVVRDGRDYTLGRATLDVTEWLLEELHRHAGGESLVWMQRGNALKNSYTTLTDSPNHFHHKDGTLCEPPVASLWIQGLAYDALTDVADLLESSPEVQREAASRGLTAEQLREEARALQQRVLDLFVTTDARGTFLSHAVDGLQRGTLEASGVRAVDMAMVLNTRLFDGEAHRKLRESVIEQCFRPEMLSPFGLRGRASNEARSFEHDYHGAVWGVMTAEAAAGIGKDAPECRQELLARVMRQTADGIQPEFTGGGDAPEVHYCPHIMTVELTMVDGEVTDSVKERTPQLFQAWTTGQLVAMEDNARQALLHRAAPEASSFGRRVIARIPEAERAFVTWGDMLWSPDGSRSLERAQVAYAARQQPTPSRLMTTSGPERGLQGPADGLGGRGFSDSL